MPGDYLQKSSTRKLWREKYNPGMGQIQHQVYNAYLKGNQVSSGTKNYSEVIGLLMSLQEDRIVL